MGLPWRLPALCTGMGGGEWREAGRAREKADGEPCKLGKDAKRGERDTEQEEIARMMAALWMSFFLIFPYIYRSRKI